MSTRPGDCDPQTGILAVKRFDIYPSPVHKEPVPIKVTPRWPAHDLPIATVNATKIAAAKKAAAAEAPDDQSIEAKTKAAYANSWKMTNSGRADDGSSV